MHSHIRRIQQTHITVSGFTSVTSTVYWWMASKLKATGDLFSELIRSIYIRVTSPVPFGTRQCIWVKTKKLTADEGTITIPFCSQSHGAACCDVAPVFRKKIISLLIFEIWEKSTWFIVTCGHLNVNCENPLLHFVIHNHIWYVSRELCHRNHPSNSNIRKYNVTPVSMLSRNTRLDPPIGSGYADWDVSVFLECMPGMCTHAQTCGACNRGTRQIQSWPQYSAPMYETHHREPRSSGRLDV